MSGPIVIGNRGPMRCASAPIRAENASMIRVIGISAAPAPSAEYPRSVWRCTTSRNVTAPKAPYTTNVTAFAPENWRDRKIPSGTMGCDDRTSMTRKLISATTPTTARNITAPVQPWAGPSMSA